MSPHLNRLNMKAKEEWSENGLSIQEMINRNTQHTDNYEMITLSECIINPRYGAMSAKTQDS